MKLEWKKDKRYQPLSESKDHDIDALVALHDYVALDFFRPLPDVRISTSSGNIIETKDDFRLQMVAPGMRKEDFTMEVQNGVLRISCEHDDNQGGLSCDYAYRSIARNFVLPENADTERIQAKYKNGTLNLILPKSK